MGLRLAHGIIPQTGDTCAFHIRSLEDELCKTVLSNCLPRPAPCAWWHMIPKAKQRCFPCWLLLGVLTVQRFRNVFCFNNSLPHSVTPVGLSTDRQVHFSIMAPSIRWFPLLQAGPFDDLWLRVLKWVSEGEAVLLMRLKPESRLIFYEPTLAILSCLSWTSQLSSNKS